MSIAQRFRRLRDGAHDPGYEAGIDGLRAVALAAVLCFHAEFAWAKGGYLGVSLFFTLSGYLITSLLLGEAERTGRIDLVRFWTRRLRRLAPASRVCLLLVAACAPLIAASGQPLKLRGDLIASLFYAANWRFLASGQSYADLFIGGPSPVLHFWSLAIEEQFYLVYPAIIAGAVLVGRRLRRAWVPVAVIATLAAASVIASILIADHDIGYYGTHLRAAELMIGGLAAYAVKRRGLDGLRQRPVVWSWLGTAGLVTFLALASTTAQSGTWLTSGGFAAVAVVWSLVVVGALVPGPLRRVLSTWPLVAIGKLSFSLYLFHWPVYLVLTPERTHLAQWPLFGLRIVVSLVVATMSYLLVETPVRTRRFRLEGWVGATAWVLATIAVVVVAVVQLQPGERSTFDQMVDSPDSVVTFDTEPSSTVDTVPASTQSIVVVGSDRSGLLKVRHLAAAAGVEVVDAVDPGCSLLDRSQSCRWIGDDLQQFVAADGSASLVVVAIGRADHAAAQARIAAGGDPGSVELADTYKAIQADLTWVDQVRGILPDVPVVVIDSAPSTDQVDDPITSMVSRQVTRYESTTLLSTADLTSADLFIAEPAGRVRVLLIGDSSSYGVALDLDRIAGERLEVMWAGLENCPLAPVVEIRWWQGAQWTLDDCLKTQAGWPALIAKFKPQVVVAVESLPEHSEQRYAGDDRWYVAGDQRFIDEHDAAIQRIVDATAPFKSSILVVDSAGTEERVTRWNDYIATWPSRFERVSLVAIGDWILAAEAAAGHSLRPDGIHLDDATLLELVRTIYLPAVEGAATTSA